MSGLDEKSWVFGQALTMVYPIIPGSYNEVNRKCGKPNCWCKTSATGHPFKRISWKEHGVSCTKAVGDDDINWVVEATGNYRKFRLMITSLEQIEFRLHEVLRELAAEIIEKTRRDKQR